MDGFKNRLERVIKLFDSRSISALLQNNLFFPMLAGLPVPEGMSAHRHALSYNKLVMLVVVIYRARCALAQRVQGVFKPHYANSLNKNQAATFSLPISSKLLIFTEPSGNLATTSNSPPIARI